MRVVDEGYVSRRQIDDVMTGLLASRSLPLSNLSLFNYREVVSYSYKLSTLGGYMHVAVIGTIILYDLARMYLGRPKYFMSVLQV